MFIRVPWLTDCVVVTRRRRDETALGSREVVAAGVALRPGGVGEVDEEHERVGDVGVGRRRVAALRRQKALQAGGSGLFSISADLKGFRNVCQRMDFMAGSTLDDQVAVGIALPGFNQDILFNAQGVAAYKVDSRDSTGGFGQDPSEGGN